MILDANIGSRRFRDNSAIMDCPMNILTREKQVAVISAPTEGCSIRSVERLTNIHRDTIMRLGVRIGDGCAALHNDMMQFVQVNRLELDELWSYVGKKQRQLKPTDPADLGDQYVFLGIDGTRKAIISYRVGKRDSYNTHAFLAEFSPADREQTGNLIRWLLRVSQCGRKRLWSRLHLRTDYQ